MRLVTGGAHQALHFGDQPRGEVAVLRQQRLLVPAQRQLPAAHREAAVLAEPELPQTRQGRADGRCHLGVVDGREVAVYAAGGGEEPVALGFDEGGIVEVGDAGEDLDAEAGGGLQTGQVPVAAHLRLRQVLGAGLRRLAQLAEASHRVEELVVDGGDEHILQRVLHRGQLGAQDRAAGRQGKAFGQRVLDDVDVGHQRLAVLAHVRVALALADQGGQVVFERLALAADAAGDRRQCLRRRRRGQARGRRHQRAGALGDAEGRGHFRDAALVHQRLGVADPVEGEPGH